jgi:hypothetical protein
VASEDVVDVIAEDDASLRRTLELRTTGENGGERRRSVV